MLQCLLYAVVVEAQRALSYCARSLYLGPNAGEMAQYCS
jgi:hypothetical protein